MRKVKVWGGTHPDEITALACVDSLEADPIPGVSAGIANQLARQLGRRLVDVNMANAFPGSPDSLKYEERRAVEVLKESRGYDAVVDLHNMNYNGENTGLVDQEGGVDSIALGFLGSLGIRNLVVVSFGGLLKYVPNAFAFETVATGLGGDIERLRDAFDGLANDPDPPRARAVDFRWFSHLASLHVGQVTPDCLSQDLRENLHGFDPLPEAVTTNMGFEGVPVHLMSWRYTPNENGFWGEAVTPIATPDDSLWPK